MRLGKNSQVSIDLKMATPLSDLNEDTSDLIAMC